VANAIRSSCNINATFNRLQKAGVACIPSFLFTSKVVIEPGLWVLKANDSVGCDEVYLLQEEQHWKAVLAKLIPEHRYILQPYIAWQRSIASCPDKHIFLPCSLKNCAHLAKIPSVSQGVDLLTSLCRHHYCRKAI
jgi:hypothetical protein